MLGRRLRLVEAGEAAIMALVQAPVLLDRQPEAAHFLQHQVQRLDGAGLDGGVALVEVQPLFPEQAAGGAGFLRALLGHVHVPPAGKRFSRFQADWPWRVGTTLGVQYIYRPKNRGLRPPLGREKSTTRLRGPRAHPTFSQSV